MTKEELEKEAEEKYSKVDREFIDCQDEGEVFNIGYILGAEPREKRIEELEKENSELKADNDARKFAMAMSEKVEKQLREENAKLKDEWQEQVQKATDEGYARTLQTIQLTKAKELLERLLITSCNSDVLNLLPNCSEVLRVRVEAEQFLKDEPQSKWVNPVRTTNDNEIKINSEVEK